jgi:hypothetical protein
VKPSKLFHTVQRQIEERQLDDKTALLLPKKPWPEICKQLELGDKVCKSFTENEGRAITNVAVEDYLGSFVEAR